jgi:hypothetical protein
MQSSTTQQPTHRGAPSLNTQELAEQIQRAVNQVASLSAKKSGVSGLRAARQSVNAGCAAHGRHRGEHQDEN